MNEVQVLRRAPSPGPAMRARPFRSAADRRSRIDNLLSPAEQEELTGIATVLDYRRPGIAIFAEGEDAHFLFAADKGTVRISRHDANGNRQILSFLWHGDIFGLSENGRYINSADTVNPAIIYRFPLQRLRRLLAGKPGLQLHLLTKAVHDLRAAQRQVLVLGQLNVPQRLVLFLHDLTQHRDIYDRTAGRLSLGIGRLDIADYLGTSPEHVARAFRALEQQRILKRRGPRTVDILRPEALDVLTSR